MSGGGRLTWDEVVTLAGELGGTVYLATVSPTGEPHVSPVGLGFDDAGGLWTATGRGSVKGRNLAAGSAVAVHWPEADAGLLLLRGSARLVDHPDETRRLWSSGVLPYGPETYWSGPDDPQLCFVQVVPERVTLTAWGAPPRRWLARRS